MEAKLHFRLGTNSPSKATLLALTSEIKGRGIPKLEQATAKRIVDAVELLDTDTGIAVAKTLTGSNSPNRATLLSIHGAHPAAGRRPVQNLNTENRARSTPPSHFSAMVLASLRASPLLRPNPRSGAAASNTTNNDFAYSLSDANSSARFIISSSASHVLIFVACWNMVAAWLRVFAGCAPWIGARPVFLFTPR